MSDLRPTTIHFTTQTDAGFFLPTMVMATSAKENMKEGSHYHFHLFYDELAPWQLEAAKRMETPSFQVSLHHVVNGRHQQFGKTLQVTPISLVRLELPERLSDIDKVLYMDGDIIVHTDLSDLYNTELGDNYIAAVRDPYTLVHDEYTSQFPGRAYVNSGVMLMNLKQLREEHVVDKFFEAKANPQDFWRFQDQDVVNFCCANRIVYLHPKYNEVYSVYNGMTDERLKRYNIMHETDYQDVESIHMEAEISHLAGLHGKRPWDKACTVFSELWVHYYLKSPLKHIHIPLNTPWTEIGYLWKRLNPLINASNKPPYRETKIPTKSCTRCGIAKWLPVFKVKATHNAELNIYKKKVWLFGFIPLVAIKGNQQKQHWYLFFVIPIWRMQYDAA